MPYCAILTCKNDSRTINVSHGGVSYHRFPKDPLTKEKWIEATGRQNWMPTKSSTICSEHFNEKNIQISKRGYKYLGEYVVPTQKILTFLDKNQPGSSRKRRQKIPSLTSINSDPKDTTQSAAIEKRLKMMLQFSYSRIRKQNLKIKCLQSQIRVLQRKIQKLEGNKELKRDLGKSNDEALSPVIEIE